MGYLMKIFTISLNCRYYSVTFFCLVGISQPILLSIILGPIAILASVTSVLLIDRVIHKNKYFMSWNNIVVIVALWYRLEGK